MTKTFIKTKYCGCVVMAILCGINHTPNGEMYSIGGHNHFIICDKCKYEEKENDTDTLHNMWLNDNVTNTCGYAGWKEYS